MTRSTLPLESKIRTSPERKQARFCAYRLPDLSLGTQARRRVAQKCSAIASNPPAPASRVGNLGLSLRSAPESSQHRAVAWNQGALLARRDDASSHLRWPADKRSGFAKVRVLWVCVDDVADVVGQPKLRLASANGIAQTPKSRSR
jgi:hypothetical protein